LGLSTRGRKAVDRKAAGAPAPRDSRHEPKQLRSRLTEERVLLAVERILSRTGTAEFSLASVAKAAGVSVGGLYRRFPGKGAILHAVQMRIYRELDEEYDAVERAAMAAEASLAVRLDILVAGVAGLLRHHSAGIKAIVEASWSHREVARQGVKELESHRLRFKTLLMRHADEIRHEDPGQALEFCIACVYELVASHFGFGRRVPAEQKRWPELVLEMQRLCLAYLTAPPRGAARRPAARSAKRR
jgi:AcrR family transcriptional regulator